MRRLPFDGGRRIPAGALALTKRSECVINVTTRTAAGDDGDESTAHAKHFDWRPPVRPVLGREHCQRPRLKEDGKRKNVSWAGLVMWGRAGGVGGGEGGFDQLVFPTKQSVNFVHGR